MVPLYQNTYRVSTAEYYTKQFFQCKWTDFLTNVPVSTFLFFDSSIIHYTVTLPAGVSEGQTIHVQAPNGKINAIVVPPGFGPGSTFTVEFAPEEKPATPAPAATAPPSMKQDETNYHNVVPPSSSVSHSSNHQGDDGFASGFNNPNYRPPAPTAQATTNFSDDYYAQYPTTHATPVGYK